MNAFEQHGITHLSASQLNLYKSAPALWGMERLLGKRGGVGISADRGTATETGVAMGLRDPKLPLSECVKYATDQFNRLTALKPGDKDKERDALPGFIETALKELRQYGTPDFPERGQHKIKLKIPEIPVPLVGYLDFVYPEHGLVVDLKTTHRVPGEISPTHAIQGAIYERATNYEVRFAYTSPKKIQVYKLENSADHINAVVQVAKRLERFLALSTDPHELVALMVPDYDSFYWNDPNTRALGKEVFGF